MLRAIPSRMSHRAAFRCVAGHTRTCTFAMQATHFRRHSVIPHPFGNVQKNPLVSLQLRWKSSLNIPISSSLSNKGVMQQKKKTCLKKTKSSDTNTAATETIAPHNDASRQNDFQTKSTQLHTDSAASMNSQTAPSSGDPATLCSPSLMDQVRKYGLGGFLLYSLIHFFSMLLLLALIGLGVDLIGLARSYNLPLPLESSPGGDLLTLFVFCIALNKLFVPLHVSLTLVLAPRYAPLLSKWARSLF